MGSKETRLFCYLEPDSENIEIIEKTMIEDRITQIVEPVIADMGFQMVALDYTGTTLQIMAEDPKTGNLSIDDCAAISRAISPALDVEDPIKSAYRLEVSSPGIDRPLVRESDFERFISHEAKMEVDPPVEDNRKRYRGIITKFEDGHVTLDTDMGDVSIPFSHIRKAKLVLTDRLINETKISSTNPTEN